MSLVLDTHGFTAMVEGLQKISGKDFAEILVLQTVALLNNCVRHTRAAKLSTIVKKVSARNNYIQFEDGHVVSVWKKADHADMFLDESNWTQGRRGQKAPTLVKGKSWHQMDAADRHWSDARWGRYQLYLSEAKRRRIDLAAAKASRGVSKASWLQIARDLGVDLNVPAYVRNAAPSNGKTYKNGTARRMLEGAAFFIEIANNNPIVVGRLNGAAILQRGIDARLKAFETDLKKGTFENLKVRAQRYPGIFVSSAS